MAVALGRIGVIGDVHAEDARLAAALAVLEERRVELVVATGDIADGVGSVDSCCTLLKSHQVVTVAGNHDRWLLSGAARSLPNATSIADITTDTHEFLTGLPRMVELATTKGIALLCHGLGPNDMAKVGPDDFGYALETNDDLQNLLRAGYFRWVINGHSHRRMVKSFPGLTIVNAGTLASNHSPCFLEVDFVRDLVLVFEFAPGGSIVRDPIHLPLA